jgi:hypothetical protein
MVGTTRCAVRRHSGSERRSAASLPRQIPHLLVASAKLERFRKSEDK